MSPEDAVAAVASGSHRPYFIWPCPLCGKTMEEGWDVKNIPGEAVCLHDGSKHRFSQDSVLVRVVPINGDHAGEALPGDTTGGEE